MLSVNQSFSHMTLYRYQMAIYYYFDVELLFITIHRGSMQDWLVPFGAYELKATKLSNFFNDTMSSS